MDSVQKGVKWVPSSPLARPANISVSSLKVENFLKENKLPLWLLLIGVGDVIVNPTVYLHSFLIEDFLFCLTRRGSVSNLPLQ